MIRAHRREIVAGVGLYIKTNLKANAILSSPSINIYPHINFVFVEIYSLELFNRSGHSYQKPKVRDYKYIDSREFMLLPLDKN